MAWRKSVSCVPPPNGLNSLRFKKTCRKKLRFELAFENRFSAVVIGRVSVLFVRPRR